MLAGADLSPLYTQVANELRARIESGTYPPQTAIPSQSSLLEEFQVSSITIRRALRELTFEGLIYSRQGLGVYVSDRRKIAHLLSSLVFTSIREDIAKAGFAPSIKEISFERTDGDHDAYQLLRVRRNASVYKHEKLILADGVPIGLDTVYLPGKLALQIRHELTYEFVFAVLAKHSINVGRTKRSFEAGLANPREAEILAGSTPLPLIIGRYHIFGEDDAPILTGKTAARADRVQFEIVTG
jgi:GntR family transcriptional regulator